MNPSSSTPIEKTALMTAAVIAAPRTLELKQVRIPMPGSGEVRIRLKGCGVCGSNVTPWEGTPWTQYPFEPGAMGHESWGTVDALGKGVQSLKVGDVVTGLTYNSYAQYDLAKAEHVIRLPDQLRDKPFPGESLGCAMNIFRRSQIRAGQTVAIVGVGFLGALLVRLATHAGARVIAISRRPTSLEVARRMGAKELIPMDDHARIVSRVKELTDEKLCDVVIEAVGKQWPLDLSAEITGERGRLVIAGYHQDGPRQVNLWLWNWRGLDVINAHERDPQVYLEGIRAAIDAVASGVVDPSPLYTHRFPLDRLDAALTATQERPDGFMKALVVYE